MAFCQECGTQLEESGICSKCPSPKTTTTQGETTPEQHPDVVNVQTEPNPLILESITILKQFFSPKPQDAVLSAINSKTHIWAILGGLNFLITALAVMLIPGALLKSLLGPLGGYLTGSLLYVSMFGFGLAISIISFAVLCACVKGIYAIFKIQVSFIKIMNMISATLLASTFASVVALLFSWFYADLTILILILGWFGSTILIYIGIQRTASFNKSPFWAFLAANGIYIAISQFIIVKLIMPILKETSIEVFGNILKLL